jgi:hypothetical protein
MVCAACRHQASVTAGTILDKARTPLTTWFEAAWHVTTAKNGPSAQTMELSLMSYGHALEQFDLALELNPTDIEARQKRAIVLGRLGKITKLAACSKNYWMKSKTRTPKQLPRRKLC